MTDVVGYRRPYWDTQPEYLHPSYRSTQKRSPKEPLILLPHTLSEVTGPLFGLNDLEPIDDPGHVRRVAEELPGERAHRQLRSGLDEAQGVQLHRGQAELLRKRHEAGLVGLHDPPQQPPGLLGGILGRGHGRDR